MVEHHFLIISSMKIAVLGADRGIPHVWTRPAAKVLAKKRLSRRSAEHITKQAGLRSNWIQLGGFSTLEIAQMMCPLHPFASFLFPVELIEPHFSFHERAPLYGFYLVFYPFPYTLALERVRLL